MTERKVIWIVCLAAAVLWAPVALVLNPGWLAFSALLLVAGLLVRNHESTRTLRAKDADRPRP